MAFTEFYCQTTGSNLNAGSTTADSAAYTATNGGWNSGTGVFTPASGNPSLTVSVGDFASVYTDGATVTGFVGRVTAVSSTTITVSITAKSGTIPTTGASGISCKVGGAWKGPNGTESFPFGFITNAQTNSSGDAPRVNFKSGVTYSITAAMTQANNGVIVFEGYTSTVGDGGRAIIDGGTSGASYTLLTISGNRVGLCSFIFQNNGATGTAAGVNLSNSNYFVRNVVVNSVRGNGLVLAGNTLAVECEAYACNQSNTANTGGFNFGGNGTMTRCIAHDNTGSNNVGCRASGATTFLGCIFESNGGAGLQLASASNYAVIGCDFYNNGADGIFCSSPFTPAMYQIASCNFVKNTGYGINGNSATTVIGTISNCGFGSGTQANTTANTVSLGSLVVSGSVTYASNVTPWVDPANGDFRINLAAAKNAGRGAFVQTAASYAGTIAYPDIGAGQHLDAGGMLRHPGMTGGCPA